MHILVTVKDGKLWGLDKLLVENGPVGGQAIDLIGEQVEHLNHYDIDQIKDNHELQYGEYQFYIREI